MFTEPDLTPVAQEHAPASNAAPLWGPWFARKISLTLTLTSLVPLVILAYSLYTSAMSWVGYEPVYGRDLLWSHALLFFTGLLMAAGGFVIRELASTLKQTAETVAATSQIESVVAQKTDQIGLLMGSFSKMLSTIETQTGEINQFATRLDAAYRELESTNVRLKEVSFKDEVTRLYNRRFFSIRLEEEVSRFRRFNHPVTVVLLDLDGFKSINDDFGHPVGDETLRGVAELLLTHSRGINVISRYGGDEFAVLLVETTKAGAQIYADRIRNVLAHHVFPHGHRISASFGIASLPEDVGPVAEDLIQAADEALYSAKRAGKNRVEFHHVGAAAIVPAARVALSEISGASDGPNGGLPPVRQEPGAALEVLAAAAYDLILRPAAPGAPGDRDPEDPWRRGEMCLVPTELRPLSRTERATLAALHGLIAARDLGTGDHSKRVLVYAEAVARAHGLAEAELRDLEHGVLLHDIGKIGIPDSILLKPGPLSRDEWKVMRTHPQVGRLLVEPIPFLAGAVPIIYHHHERWDGNGYPDGLGGEGIPLNTRIFAVADALDAMTFDRPYSRAIPIEAARDEIARCAGSHFDPAVVATFLAISLKALRELRHRATS